MRRKWGSADMISRTILLFALIAIGVCDGARRTAHRRKDTPALLEATPSAETLQALAQAVGAAGFEHYTEGRPLVKRLIPANSQPDLDVVEHQGVIGRAGVDFPAFPNIPATGFNCKNVPTGYYADLETDCQVFHICDTSRKISFLCPNGTIFSQSHLICDWWFKVDCASAPALYESSAEYYSNEQKKSQKIAQTNSRNSDLQQIGSDTSVRSEPRRITDIPTTTERFLRHRQRLQNEGLPVPKATSRSFQNIYTESVFPTQRTQATTAFEKRRKNLVQLIANNFGNAQAKTTVPTYSDVPAFRTTSIPRDFNNLREMQVAAESASFANNNNRQYLQNLSKNRPYPVYTPNLPKTNKNKNTSSLTTLYDLGVNNFNQENQEITTKRSTLVPYTKSYASTSKEPYTRPGISLLRNFIEKEKNKTISTSTEKMPAVTDRSDIYETKDTLNNKVAIESKSSYETATKIPQTTRPQHTFTSSSDNYEIYSTSNLEQGTTEPTYQERRERLLRKLKFDHFKPTEATNELGNEKYYGDQPNRPGLIVPPSLTPKTLHTLAIYYATALDNISTTPAPEETEVTTHTFDEYEGVGEEGLPGLFSADTINKYSHLFGHMTDNPEVMAEIKMDPNATYNEIVDDLTVQQSQNPFATSPQIRELAQVFTHALSAYLQDPVQFRKVLSDIRPTQPSFDDMFTTEGYTNTEPTTTVNEDDEEILGFSDDNKIRSPLVALREPKQLSFATDYPTTIQQATATVTPREITEIVSTTQPLITTRRPYICCGRISASYTSASTSKPSTTTPIPYTNTFAASVNTLGTNATETINNTTEDSYVSNRFGGFQNNSINDSLYGKSLEPSGTPLTDYVIATDLPTAWGVDSTAPVSSDVGLFESKKIRSTTESPTTLPVYFTETESIELENEEELQRAQSHSFVNPQSNSIRHGKQTANDDTKTIIKKPSEELEAPTVPEAELTTVRPTNPTTTVKEETPEILSVSSTQTNVFTTPETYKTTTDFQWPSTLQNWHSTIIDPITLNDNLTPENLRKLGNQYNNWLPSTTPSPTTYTTSESAYSTTVNVEVSSPASSRHDDSRFGRLLRDQTSTEPAQDITTIADSVVEKAKEIMGGMNSTTTQKLMNVMKKTKSKTVKRLILLLVQTCDDDHNSTAEASKKALLEALMAVSQKDMDEVAKEESATELPTTFADIEAIQTTNFVRRMDQALDKQEQQAKTDRRGKSLNFEASAINSLSNPSTTERVSTTTESVTEVPSTTPITARSTITSRRGSKKFFSRTPVEVQTTKETFIDTPVAAARVAGPEEVVKTDTRALELLKSLYTIASRWG